jgi:hypothetical protein
MGCSRVSYGSSEWTCDDCTDYNFDLDGSASNDPDGDVLDDPSWSITAGSTYASITSEDSWTPRVTMSGVAGNWGSPNMESATIELTVTDCMGAEATDSVMVSYSCTGS